MMLNSFETKTLAKLKWEDEVATRRFNREIHTENAKQGAKRRLRREVERLIQVEGNAESVLDIINRLSSGRNSAPDRAEPTCC